MTFREFYRNKWVRLAFWAALYILWLVWMDNWWWLLGLPVLYELCVAQKLKSLICKKKNGEPRKGGLLSWVDALLFATIVVSFINIFFFQAFKTPSSSMESSLMTGDYLFVSKVAYGPRMPQTPISMPFVHNTMPISGRESYSTALQYDYRRIKGLGKVKRDDYVVFCFPHGDTVLAKAPAEDYYTHVRMTSREYAEKTYGPLIVRPADKKDHYVKRCVAVAGDTLEVKSGWVYVNGQPQEKYPGIQNTYRVVTTGQPLNPVTLSQMGINTGEVWYSQSLPGYPALPLTEERLEKISKMSAVASVTQNVDTYPADYYDSEIFLFPFTATGWTKDNYGPLWIPQAGSTVTLTADNISLYRRIIEVYEHNTLQEKADGSFVINGEPSQTYTFKMDYYFMMGDNRHNSLDSRYWGFVPEDHIVGKPSLIWFSSDSSKRFPRNIRWGRLMKFV